MKKGEENGIELRQKNTDVRRGKTRERGRKMEKIRRKGKLEKLIPLNETPKRRKRIEEMQHKENEKEEKEEK